MNAPYRSILWLHDGSDRAAAAQDWVLGLGRLGAQGVHVAHATGAPLGASDPFPHDPGGLEPRLLARARGAVDAACATLLLEGLPSRAWVEVGQPATLAERIHREAGVDLAVCWRSGQTGLDRLLLGSTAARLVRELPCDVLVVANTEGVQLKRLLVAVDPNHDAQPALARAGQIARHTGARITLLTVIFEANPDALAAARARVEALARPLLGEGDDALPLHCVAVHARVPADGILRLAGDHDLVIIGTHGRRGLARLLLGSVAQAVVQHCPRSVLVTRPLAPSESL